MLISDCSVLPWTPLLALGIVAGLPHSLFREI